MGIIGYGGMASYHVDCLKAYERLEVKGVYDVNPERMKVAVQNGLKAYSSKEAILHDPELDLILIATTNEVHMELSIEAMAAGKHVICEKPVTLSSIELSSIMEAEKEYGKIFTINHNRRSNKDFVLMKRSVEAGLLGEVYVIESRVEGSRGMPKGWRTIKELGGGMMLDWGVHLIDQLLHMSDDRVVSVSCKMFSIQYPEVDDNFRLTLTFEKGLIAHVEVSTNNYITHPRWYVLGTEGTLQIDDWNCDGKIVRCIDPDSTWEDEIVYTKAGPTKTMAPRRKESTETLVLTEPLDVTDHLCVVYDGWIDAIEEKRGLSITTEQAMRVMKVMEAAFEADKTGRTQLVSI
nr:MULTISPECIES: Gfo/Idh/MocA family oxidoreductase [unclassified Fusibacter]